MSDKLKLLPVVVMLIAGGCTGILTIVFKYESIVAIWILVGVLVLFYILGVIIQKVIYKFEKQIEEEEARQAEEEGKVVEKEGAAPEEDSFEGEGDLFEE